MRIPLGDDGHDAFVAANPRALVLYRGVGCPYSRTFERVFGETEVAGWARLVQEVEEGGEGPVGDRHRVELTPTVAAFVDGRESARLEAKLLLGITRQQYARWVRGL